LSSEKSNSPTADLDRSLSGFRRGLLIQPVHGVSVSRTRALSILLINSLEKPSYGAFLELSLHPYNGGAVNTASGVEPLLSHPTIGRFGFFVNYYRLWRGSMEKDLELDRTENRMLA